MNCQLNSVGKYFNSHIIFSGISTQLQEKGNYVILGGNGSGKSTLLKTIAGGVSPSEGEITYSHQGQNIALTDLPKFLSFCSPYMEVIEEFTFEELITFQRKFKPFVDQLSAKEIILKSGLKGIARKPIRHFSSGMKQRVKLCMAILSNTPLLLLDEPTSNLDPKGKLWYKSLLNEYSQDKTVIVASNFLEEEYPEKPIFIELANYKG